MDRKRIKNGYRQIVFYILLIFAMGYLPSRIGMNLLLIAILACPINPLRSWVDRFLDISSGRLTWYVILAYFLGCYPLHEYEIIMNRIRNILNLIFEWIK